MARLLRRAEQGAAEIRLFEPIVVPGLLQTLAYITAVVDAVRYGLTAEQRQRYIENRLARQRALHRWPEPLRLCAVIDESVLMRQMGDHTVMASQLDHLIVMAARPNADLRVTPLDASISDAAFGAFKLLVPAEESGLTMACTEDLTGFRYHESPQATGAFTPLYDHLVHVALSPDDSVERIRTIARERYW